MAKLEETTYTKLFEKNGPLLRDKVLFQALGFNSYRVFYQHLTQNQITVRVFKIKGRKGWFAKTEDIAKWIDEVANTNMNL